MSTQVDARVGRVRGWVGRFDDVTSWPRRVGAALGADWEGTRALAYGAIVVVLESFVTLAYYVNVSSVPGDPDSAIYLHIANDVIRGHFANPVRTPFYPLFIEIFQLVVGAHYIDAVSIAQGILFIVSMAGCYTLAYRLFRRAWMALVTTLPVAMDVVLLSYMRPIMTEALALFLLTSIALLLIWFVRAPQPRTLWLLFGLLFVLSMTRPEWVYFAVLLTGFTLLIAWRQDMLRQLLPHALAALFLFAALCGLYVLDNVHANHYAGFGQNQNVDILGKVMQYDMQNEAPSQYQAVSKVVDGFVARGDLDPWHVVIAEPAFQNAQFSGAAQYGYSIIERHPVEFVADTIPVIFDSLRSSEPHQSTVANQPFGGLLALLQDISSVDRYSLLLFPFIALLWWVRFLRRRTDLLAAAMAGVSLLAVYPLLVTTLFVYTQYARMNVPFDPLMFVVVWGSLLFFGAELARRRWGKGTQISADTPIPSKTLV